MVTDLKHIFVSQEIIMYVLMGQNLFPDNICLETEDNLQLMTTCHNSMQVTS